MLEDLINQQWRAHVRNNISADDLADELDGIDWDDDASWSWCAEIELDAGGVPHVMVDHGPCVDDDLPEIDDERVLVACPIAEDTRQNDLLEFDAAEGSDWEEHWIDDNDEE